LFIKIKMNKLKSLFGSVAQGVKKMSPSGVKQSKIFVAYEQKNYDEMVRIASKMSAQEFLAQCRVEDLTLLHKIALDDNLPAMMTLSQLSFIHDIVNDGENTDGWTPLLTAASLSGKTNLQMINLLVKLGANLKAQKHDGMTILHMAASTNDIQLIDFVLSNTDDK